MAETHTSYDRLNMEPLNLKTFGQRLRALRLEAEQTQDEFAARIGLSKQILSRLEKGQQMPKLDQVQDYAEKLGLPSSSALTFRGSSV